MYIWWKIQRKLTNIGEGGQWQTLRLKINKIVDWRKWMVMTQKPFQRHHGTWWCSNSIGPTNHLGQLNAIELCLCECVLMCVWESRSQCVIPCHQCLMMAAEPVSASVMNELLPHEIYRMLGSRNWTVCQEP